MVSARKDDGLIANAMPALLTLAYFAVMGWVYVAGGQS